MSKLNLVAFRNVIDQTLPTWAWWALGLIGFFAFQVVMTWLGGLYEGTEHPASIIDGQTTFSGEKIKGFYAVMMENGTLAKYTQVQLYDYLLMLSMFSWLFPLCIAVYRSLPNVGWLKRSAWIMALVFPLAPFFDAIENAISFFMLANPTDFMDWLAFPYSSFAVIKFFLGGLGFVWIILGSAIVAILTTAKLVRNY